MYRASSGAVDIGVFVSFIEIHTLTENWIRPPGRPHTTWMKTILQQDLKSNSLSLNEAIDVAQNRQLWRLMSAFGIKKKVCDLDELSSAITE